MRNSRPACYGCPEIESCFFDATTITIGDYRFGLLQTPAQHLRSQLGMMQRVDQLTEHCESGAQPVRKLGIIPTGVMLCTSTEA